MFCFFPSFLRCLGTEREDHMPVKKLFSLLLLGHIPIVLLYIIVYDYRYLADVVRYVNIVHECLVGSLAYKAFLEPFREKMRTSSDGK